MLVGWLVAAAGCGSKVVSLGQPEPKDAGGVVDAPSFTAEASLPEATIDAPAVDAPPADATADGWTPPEASSPVLVTKLESSAQTDNPTLTDDLLLIFFSSLRDGDAGTNSDVWFASRSSADAAFGAPQRIPALSTELIEGSPAISGDGLTLWLSIKTIDDGATSDIWRSTRPSLTADWPPPTRVTDLNSSEDDIPRPLGNGNLTMPLGSRRDGSHFLTYFASRASIGAPFGAFREASELDIDPADINTADAFLTQDGLTIYFAHSRSSLGDIYVAHRATTGAPFDPPQPLPGINTAADERDPWVNPEGNVLYFTSNRDGPVNIYRANLAQH
jgi:hypothetical protein